MVITDGRMISLTFSSAGMKTVRLPERGTVRDALGGETFGGGARHVTPPVRFGETRVTEFDREAE